MGNTAMLASLAFVIAAILFVLDAILVFAEANGRFIGGIWYLAWGVFAAGAAAYVSHATGLRRSI